MINTDNLHIYVATRKPEDASQLEDNLVLDGFDVSSFPSAKALWDGFQQKPARFIITNRQFGDGFSGLDLARKVREHHLMPYVYIVVLSAMNRLTEIKEGLAGGVDDYLLKPHNPLQLRSRILVGMRWLNYIDSLNKGKAAKIGVAKGVRLLRLEANGFLGREGARCLHLPQTQKVIQPASAHWQASRSFVACPGIQHAASRQDHCLPMAPMIFSSHSGAL